MISKSNPVIAYVTFQASTETRLERDYRMSRHMRRAMRRLRAGALESSAALFPAVARASRWRSTSAASATRRLPREAWQHPSPVITADAQCSTDVVAARTHATDL